MTAYLHKKANSGITSSIRSKVHNNFFIDENALWEKAVIWVSALYQQATLGLTISLQIELQGAGLATKC